MEDISMPNPNPITNTSINYSNIGHQYGYSMDINPRNEEMLKLKDEKIRMLNKNLSKSKSRSKSTNQCSR